jgi:hypothetical protein
VHVAPRTPGQPINLTIYGDRMSGGGKGGKTTTQVQIPKWLETAAQQNIARASDIGAIGYTPYYGPDVAALTPQQVAAMQGTNQAAGAFGMPTADPMAGMPQAGDYGGMQAYSSGGMYDQALAELQARNPAQFAAIQASLEPRAIGSSTPAPVTLPFRPTSNSSGGGGGVTPTSSGGGYTGLRDMFDGGGPGTSGSTFSGGPFSGRLNTIGVKPAGSGGSSGMGGGK